MKIGIAADHAGQGLRSAIEQHLRARGHDVRAYGPPSDPDDDYPLIARVLGDAIARGEVERGIFCCGSGIGPAVALSKLPGVRAAVVDNEWSARDAVTHVDVNVLTLGERVIGVDLAKSVVDAYLDARPEGGRHERRRAQIKELERATSGFAARSESTSRSDNEAIERRTK
ncbi:MAG TPA: RpiB/LacA/LacB family sugar-phosphate isomerase [Candidatus Limnocylindrales bacterium]|nr:RpiB/LacA/LacB family sugar-phosphate isomerase [Candidatus Limnocylindrales bacterium]